LTNYDSRSILIVEHGGEKMNAKYDIEISGSIPAKRNCAIFGVDLFRPSALP